MSEINGPKISVNQVNFSGISKPVNEAQQEIEQNEKPQISDFSNPSAEALGRSMLVKDIDNTDHDLKALIDNPQIAENSDEMFEAAFKAAQQAGVENPYEEAASVSTGSV